MAVKKRSMVHGDTLEFDVATGVDLTGCAIWCTGKKDRSHADSLAVFQKTYAGGGITSVSLAGGTVTVKIGYADTEPLAPWQLLFYDLQYQEPGGDVVTAERGTIFVGPGATGTRS